MYEYDMMIRALFLCRVYSWCIILLCSVLLLCFFLQEWAVFAFFSRKSRKAPHTYPPFLLYSIPCSLLLLLLIPFRSSHNALFLMWICTGKGERSSIFAKKHPGIEGREEKEAIFCDHTVELFNSEMQIRKRKREWDPQTNKYVTLFFSRHGDKIILNSES